jgi:DNA-directed RNA polymerase specialized sigma24 family protein
VATLIRIRKHGASKFAEQFLKPAAISDSIGMAGTAVRKALQRIREQLRSCVERKAAAGGV